MCVAVLFVWFRVCVVGGFGDLMDYCVCRQFNVVSSPSLLFSLIDLEIW